MAEMLPKRVTLTPLHQGGAIADDEQATFTLLEKRSTGACQRIESQLSSNPPSTWSQSSV
ncbi:MAG TPA: hypothetical protein DEP84_20435 [Chloroflexi bacterium]|nr:hypothetical protein [Chloroflexota bacterium]